MNFVADVCHRCGKKVVKRLDIDSSDMVKTHDSFLYLCDLKPGESCRPSLQLKDYGPDSERGYCLNCLLTEVTEWVQKMKERGASKISPRNIIFGDIVTSPCPICGK